MKKVFQKDNVICFIIVLALACFIYQGYLSMHYAADTYNIINVGYETYAKNWSFIDGRPIMGIIGMIAEGVHLPIKAFVIGLTFLALIVSSIAVVVLKNILSEYKKNDTIIEKIITTIISFVTIFNFMYIENLYFVESFVMAISVLSYLLAAHILVKRQKHYLIKTQLLLVLGIICYQGTIGFFFVMTTLISFMNNKNDFKRTLVTLVQSGALALIAVIFNILQVKIVEKILNRKQIRIGGIKSIWSNLLYISNNMTKILIDTCQLFPSYYMIIFASLIIIISILFIIIKKEEKLKIAELFLLTGITILSAFIIFLITTSSFYAGRLRFCLGALVGVIFGYTYVRTNLFEKTNVFKILILFILIGYFGYNSYYSLSLINQHKTVNQLERIQVAQIDNQINEYETETGNKIEKIAVITITGQASKTFFKEVENKSVLTYNAVRCDWSTEGAINFYTRRNLEKITPSYEELANYKNEARKIRQDQMCIGDTLYISAYMY